MEDQINIFPPNKTSIQQLPTQLIKCTPLLLQIYKIGTIILLLKKRAKSPTLAMTTMTTPPPAGAGKSKYKIGQGSFGTVYRYSHEHQEYALKKIYKDTKNHPELVQKIEAQGSIMQLVSGHRNIVGFLGEMTKGKYQYLLTELAPDGDLRKLRDLPCEDDVWEIVMQLAMGLEHLRKNNVVHRDIKPQNILIKMEDSGQSGQEMGIVLKLADFGLAEILGQGRTVEGIAGSPVYLAPQMCNYEAYSYEVDIWSLGITLYQLVNNQKSPYHADLLTFMNAKPNHTEKQLFNFLLGLIKTSTIKCNSSYPEVNRLIQSMLNRDPKLRPTPRQILRHERVLERLQKFNRGREGREHIKMGKTLSLSTRAQLSQQKDKSKHPIESSPGCPTIKKSPSKMDENNHDLAYSQSFNDLQLYLSSRLTNSIIQQLVMDNVEQSFQQISLEPASVA